MPYLQDLTQRRSVAIKQQTARLLKKTERDLGGLYSFYIFALSNPECGKNAYLDYKVVKLNQLIECF